MRNTRPTRSMMNAREKTSASGAASVGSAGTVSAKRLGRAALALVIGLTTLLAAASADAAWYNSSWQYRKKLTIDYTKVGASLSNFPVLVSLSSDSDLAARARSDGYDILFTSSDGSTKLDHEIEYFDDATGQLVAHVKIPSLSNSADTEIYMYYGNAGASNQQNKTGVWSSNFEGVWHLSNNDFTDSTPNANNGTNSGTSDAAGQIAGGRQGNASNNYIRAADHASLTPSNDMSFSIWVRLTSLSYFTRFVQKEHNASPWQSYQLFADTNGSISFLWVNSAATNYQVNSNAGAVSTGAWYHIAGVHSSGTLRIYLNGADVSNSTVNTTGTTFDSNTFMTIGNNGNFASFPSGIIDEVRLSSSGRSAGWISTEYANQSNPGPASGAFFKSLGDQETESGGGSGYSYRKPITIDYTKVGSSCSSNLTNFPVLINIASDNDLRTTANGGDVQNASGYDITFRGSDGTTVLDHEVEKYTPSTGELVVWVRIPTLDYNENTTIYVYYGNAAISSSQENKTGVWDSSYKGVWHLKESGSGAAGEYKDSTSNNNNGQGAGPAPALTAGILDGAQNFDGSNDYISVPNSSSLELTAALTIQGWVRLDGFGSGVEVDIVGRKGEDNPNNYQLCIANSTLSLKLDENDDGGLFGATTLSTGTWYHVTGTWDGTTRRVYVNGVEDGSGSRGGTLNTDTRPFYIGGRSGTDLSDGIIDEVRVSNIARPACWIQTEYNNQNSPGAFYSIGAEQNHSVAVNLTQVHARWRNDDGAEAGSADWWNSSYLYRKKVTFGTSHSLLPLGYTATVNMDTRTANTNVELTSGNDVRVVWQLSSGSAVELDRIGSAWNNVATSIEFRLQSEIGANLEEDPDGSYYIYYGNALAGTPPSDERNVYYFADFFNRANNTDVKANSSQDWTEWINGGGNVSIASNALSVVGNNAGPTDAGVKQTFPLGAITGNFTVSFDWTMPSNTEEEWSHYINIGNSATMVDNNRRTGVGPAIYTGEGGHFSPNGVENVNNDLSDASNMETNVNGGPHSIRMVVNTSGNTYDYYRGGTLRASSQAFVNSGVTLNQIRIATDLYASGQPAFVYNNLKTVLDVSSAPSTVTSTEEVYVASGATWAAT